MKLNLGCGNDVREGWQNVDNGYDLPDDVITLDLNTLHWMNWTDNSVSEIECFDVLEHLKSTVNFINECWRVLKPGGTLKIQVPRYDHPNVWLDPTHLRAYHPDTFDYFDPTTKWGQLYQMYSPYKWTILEKIDGIAIVVKMTPVKELK